MDLSEVQVIAALKNKMSYHAERQVVLSQNVANADTPGYKARDLEKFTFKQALGQTGGLKTTHPNHISHVAGGGKFSSHSGNSFETNLTGNSVNLEEQMLKMNENAIDYRATTSLYKKMSGLIKTASGADK